MTIFTTLGSILKNPIWRAKNLFTYTGDAQAPTLWSFDQYGFASPSNGRVMSPSEADSMSKYYAYRASMNEAGRSAIDDVMKDIFPSTMMAQQCNRDFQAARSWTARRDPLVLDLDGDGIEALAINPANPVLFDHNGDNIKTATGWIKADDGIVVLDRNNNGLIDSGRELFGDNTVLTRGPRAGQLAANGFEALANLDLNNDGQLDALDAAYIELRVWQDTNQDGISSISMVGTKRKFDLRPNCNKNQKKLNYMRGCNKGYTRACATTTVRQHKNASRHALIASHVAKKCS